MGPNQLATLECLPSTSRPRPSGSAAFMTWLRTLPVSPGASSQGFLAPACTHAWLPRGTSGSWGAWHSRTDSHHRCEQPLEIRRYPCEVLAGA